MEVLIIIAETTRRQEREPWSDKELGEGGGNGGEVRTNSIE
jgi:hypothetical protein